MIKCLCVFWWDFRCTCEQNQNRLSIPVGMGFLCNIAQTLLFGYKSGLYNIVPTGMLHVPTSAQWDVTRPNQCPLGCYTAQPMPTGMLHGPTNAHWDVTHSATNAHWDVTRPNQCPLGCYTAQPMPTGMLHGLTNAHWDVTWPNQCPHPYFEVNPTSTGWDESELYRCHQLSMDINIMPKAWV